MRSVLRLRQLSVRETWCRPLPRRTAASLTLKAEDIQNHSSPIEASSLSQAVPAEPSGSQHSPPQLDPSSEEPPHPLFNLVPAVPPRTGQGLVIRYKDETASIQDLMDHLALLDAQGSLSPKEAIRTWILYKLISPSARQDLPHDVLRSTMKKVVPLPSLAVTRRDAIDALDLEARRWEKRLQVIIKDMQYGIEGPQVEDLEHAMRTLGNYASIMGVENMYHQLIRLNKNIDQAYKEKLLFIRLKTIDYRAKRIIDAPAISPNSLEQVHTGRRTILDKSRIPPDSPRMLLAESESTMVVEALWNILKEYTNGAVTATWSSIRLVVTALNHVREIVYENSFKERLDDMLDQMLKLAYGINVPSLELKHWGAGGAGTTLLDLGNNEINAVVRMLGRKGHLYRMIAAAETFIPLGYGEHVSQAIAASSSTLPDDTHIPLDEDGTSPPPTSEVDMFGRPKGSSIIGDIIHEVSEAMHAKGHEKSRAEYVPFVSPENKRRGYREFRHDSVPKLADIYVAVQARQPTATSRSRRWPHSTKWGNGTHETFQLMFNAVRDQGDVEAVLHLTRLYIDLMRHQQAYWVYKALQEHQRQVWVLQHLGKLAKEQVEAVESATKPEGEGSSPSTIKDWKACLADEWSIKTRQDTVPDPASAEILWPGSVRFPRLTPDVRMLALATSMARGSKGHRNMLRELNRITADSMNRLQAEHEILTGRPCTGEILSIEDYIKTMKTYPPGYEGRTALGEQFFFSPNANEPLPPGKVDILRYFYHLDQNYAQLKEAHVRTLEQKQRGREKRMIKTAKSEAKKQEREQSARMQQEARAQEAEVRMRDMEAARVV